MPKATVSSIKYKLTAAGQALQSAAADSESPVVGIIENKNGRVDLKQVKDEDPELSILKDTQYVEESTTS